MHILLASHQGYLVMEQPRVYPNKTVPRVYSERKAYLYNQYTRLFQSSFDTPLVFLHHNDFSIPRLIQLRRQITAAAAKHASTPSLAGPSPAPAAAAPTLTILRTSILGVALRDFAPLDRHAAMNIAQLVEGGLAVLAFPSFDPPQMQAILRALSRAVPPRKRQRPTPVPELRVVGALVEGRVFGPAGVGEVTQLPTLETLRAQLVGLLSAPAMQLAMVLGEAGGARLARTLEGLKKSLEEDQGGAS
ncbi:hypothetical protein POSPLADRAFT_1042443 [Postia placenta MAD-698-R-SB12]|uniref:50S ribosomal protein L10 n=1 Tax=Postia placenta MAD-698-R-SB12 TaxID=670580 RepID=A0A1X6NFQ3_9APHY|nr:hypothetical protein POSPLADRAFT_1042443 [Postia placenta MAD-698-R-SB12]OSX67183.1 hypothetical protein POSPLADRAFT_1042443 [Postia placenta MAD-698-R-SB12]